MDQIQVIFGPLCVPTKRQGFQDIKLWGSFTMAILERPHQLGWYMTCGPEMQWIQNQLGDAKYRVYYDPVTDHTIKVQPWPLLDSPSTSPAIGSNSDRSLVLFPLPENST